MTATLNGDCRDVLKTLPDESVHCCVTSPPYWGLRDYGHPGQIGLEPTPEAYVAELVAVFREVRRVLRSDGVCWLNLGDSYSGGKQGRDDADRGQRHTDGRNPEFQSLWKTPKGIQRPVPPGLKPKDLVGIPWSVAKALQSPFYAGRIKSELDRVWLAATIDAEGSICGFTHERKDDGTIRTGIHLTITNTNKPLLDNAFRIWPTSREDHNFHGEGHLGSADTYRWIAHNVDSKAELLREIYPYLIAKKKQALLAWNFLQMSRDAKRLARTGEAVTVKEKRAWIVAALSRLNHFENVDVPDWCIEPPSMYEPGWYLRQDIIWAKPNPMPESVTDRCTKAHEYVFLLAKSERYWYDAEAVKEAGSENSHGGGRVTGRRYSSLSGRNDGENENFQVAKPAGAAGRNRRSVWTVATQPYSGAHFATFPPALIEPMILAGCPAQTCPTCGKGWERVVEHHRRTITGKLCPKHTQGLTSGLSQPGWRKSETPNAYSRTLGHRPACACPPADPVPGVVLDPFGGSGTTGQVASRLGRTAILIELNPDYLPLSARRTAQAGLALA